VRHLRLSAFRLLTDLTSGSGRHAERRRAPSARDRSRSLSVGTPSACWRVRRVVECLRAGSQDERFDGDCRGRDSMPPSTPSRAWSKAHAESPSAPAIRLANANAPPRVGVVTHDVLTMRESRLAAKRVGSARVVASITCHATDVLRMALTTTGCPRTLEQPWHRHPSPPPSILVISCSDACRRPRHRLSPTQT
jgi:hypothetical protein